MGSAAVQHVCGEKCLLAHDLNNKLTIIIGECDLLAHLSQHPELGKPLRIIREAASKMAAAVSQHECNLMGLLRSRDSDPLE